MKEINGSLNFITYLNELKDEKPFDCPFLKVLPETIKVYSDNQYTEYERGALICSARPGTLLERDDNHRCQLKKSEIILNEQGNFEAKCRWNHSRLFLKIVGFEPKNKFFSTNF